jgi:nucleotide-binding universal stress UspA family protein
MKQILVLTDLTRESRTGMRFAIQWAKQQKASLIYAHVLYIGRLTVWSDKQYETFAHGERLSCLRKLERAVSYVYTHMGLKGHNYECRVIEGTGPEPTLQDYCRKHPDIDLICMSTHGAAGLKRFLGTHAGNMLTHSSTPVVVVPKGYRTKRISSVLYGTDLGNYEQELEMVIPLAGDLEVSLDIVHLIASDERMPNKAIFESVLSRQFHHPMHIHFPVMDETHSMAGNFLKVLQQFKPSLMVLFTNQDRTLFERIFFPSKAESLAFCTQTPMLVFPKRVKQ